MPPPPLPVLYSQLGKWSNFINKAALRAIWDRFFRACLVSESGGVVGNVSQVRPMSVAMSWFFSCMYLVKMHTKTSGHNTTYVGNGPFLRNDFYCTQSNRFRFVGDLNNCDILNNARY